MRKKTARKSLIIMLAIVITIAMMPTMAFAEKVNGGGSGNSCGANLTWSFENGTGTLTITGDGTAMDNYTVGDGVASTAPWYTDRLNIRSVVIEAANLTNIGSFAFKECINLTTVTLPNSVKTIGDEAFNGCTSLVMVMMPKVETIGVNAFRGCFKLETVIMSEVKTISGGVFAECKALTSAIMPVATTIGDYAFKNCTKLKSAVIKNGCAIGKEAFTGVAAGVKLYVLGGDSLTGDGAESVKSYKKVATKQTNPETLYKADGGMEFDTSDNSLKWTGNCGKATVEDSLKWTLDTEGTLTITGDGT
ncbi:MAG: leucine-rich repeat domain-containing protein, partial [Anaerovoracaceae bacterium]